MAQEKAEQLSKVAMAEVLGMKEQLCLLINGTDRRMEEIFCAGDSHENEADAVEAGVEQIEDLKKQLREIVLQHVISALTEGCG